MVSKAIGTPRGLLSWRIRLADRLSLANQTMDASKVMAAGMRRLTPPCAGRQTGGMTAQSDATRAPGAQRIRNKGFPEWIGHRHALALHSCGLIPTDNWASGVVLPGCFIRRHPPPVVATSPAESYIGIAIAPPRGDGLPLWLNEQAESSGDLTQGGFSAASGFLWLVTGIATRGIEVPSRASRIVHLARLLRLLVVVLRRSPEDPRSGFVKLLRPSKARRECPGSALQDLANQIPHDRIPSGASVRLLADGSVWCTHQLTGSASSGAGVKNAPRKTNATRSVEPPAQPVPGACLSYWGSALCVGAALQDECEAALHEVIDGTAFRAIKRLVQAEGHALSWTIDLLDSLEEIEGEIILAKWADLRWMDSAVLWRLVLLVHLESPISAQELARKLPRDGKALGPRTISGYVSRVNKASPGLIAPDETGRYVLGRIPSAVRARLVP